MRNVVAALSGVAFAGCGAAVRPQLEIMPLDHLISSYDGSNYVRAFEDRFSREIPSVSSVNIQSTPGANRLLIQVKDLHDVSELEGNDLTEVGETQDEVETILRYLHHNHGLESLYREGFMVGDPPSQSYAGLCRDIQRESNEYLRETLQAERELEREEDPHMRQMLEGSLRTHRRFRGEAQEQYQDCTQQMRRESLYSAAERLRGTISFHPAETHEAYDNFTEVDERIDAFLAQPFAETTAREARRLIGLRKEAYARRERVVLEQVVANGDGVGVVLYGGAHEFGPDIEEWNNHQRQTQDSDIFSLIEITPSAYERYYNETP